MFGRLDAIFATKKKKKYISNSEGSCFYETANNTKDKIIEWELISVFFYRFFSFLKDVHVGMFNIQK